MLRSTRLRDSQPQPCQPQPHANRNRELPAEPHVASTATSQPSPSSCAAATEARPPNHSPQPLANHRRFPTLNHCCHQTQVVKGRTALQNPCRSRRNPAAPPRHHRNRAPCPNSLSNPTIAPATTLCPAALSTLSTACHAILHTKPVIRIGRARRHHAPKKEPSATPCHWQSCVL